MPRKRQHEQMEKHTPASDGNKTLRMEIGVVLLRNELSRGLKRQGGEDVGPSENQTSRGKERKKIKQMRTRSKKGGIEQTRNKKKHARVGS